MRVHVPMSQELSRVILCYMLGSINYRDYRDYRDTEWVVGTMISTISKAVTTSKTRSLRQEEDKIRRAQSEKKRYLLEAGMEKMAAWGKSFPGLIGEEHNDESEWYDQECEAYTSLL